MALPKTHPSFAILQKAMVDYYTSAMNAWLSWDGYSVPGYPARLQAASETIQKIILSLFGARVQDEPIPEEVVHVVCNKSDLLTETKKLLESDLLHRLSGEEGKILIVG